MTPMGLQWPSCIRGYPPQRCNCLYGSERLASWATDAPIVQVTGESPPCPLLPAGVPTRYDILN